MFKTKSLKSFSENSSENEISSEKITPPTNQEELSNGLVSRSDEESTGKKICRVMRKYPNNDATSRPLTRWLDHVIVSKHHRQEEYQLSADCRLSLGVLNRFNATTPQPNKTAMLIQWRDYVNMVQRSMHLNKENLPSHISKIKKVTFDPNIKIIPN